MCMDKETRLGHSKGPIAINQYVFLLTKDRFANHFELCNLMRVGRKL